MKYYIELINNSDKNKEVVLQDFILQRSDTLRLTRFTWGLINKHGQDSDPKFIKAINLLKDFIIKTEKNNLKYDDIKQVYISEHYYFKLDEKLKSYLKEETIFFGMVFGTSKYFYGFEDPTFYKDGKMLVSVITHEKQIVMVDLSDEELEILKKNNINVNES